jgi:hypothetical protein
MQVPLGVQAVFPLKSESQVRKPQDITIMFFFQRDTDSQFERTPGDNYQLFRMHEDIVCFFTSVSSIECDTPKRSRLIVEYDRDLQSRWLHFTLAISESGQAYLQIRDGINIIAQDMSDNFIYRHSNLQQDT